MWLTWPLLVLWVEAKRAQHAVGLMRFYNERDVYSLVLIWLPLAIVAAQVLFLWRFRNTGELSFTHQATYRFFACLTVIGAIIIVMCWFWVNSRYPSMRVRE
jgi:hypothetical protein